MGIGLEDMRRCVSGTGGVLKALVGRKSIVYLWLTLHEKQRRNERKGEKDYDRIKRVVPGNHRIIRKQCTVWKNFYRSAFRILCFLLSLSISRAVRRERGNPTQVPSAYIPRRAIAISSKIIRL